MNTRWTVKLALAMLCVSSHATYAQNPLFKELPVPSQFEVPQGVPLGPLQLSSELFTGVMATNNVYRDSSHLASEAVQVGLSAKLTSSSDKHLVVAEIEHFGQNFRDPAYQDLDLDATTATLFGRFVTSRLTNLRLLVIDEEDILGRDQADQLNSFTSGLEHNRRYEAIFEVDNSRYFANVMVRQDEVDSESYSVTADEVQNQALDRTERDYVLLAGRSFAWGRGFVFAGDQTVEYQSSTFPLLAARNSDEYRYGAGVEYQVGKFSGDADLFRFTQRFDSPLIRDIEGEWVGSGTLNYAFSELLTLQAVLERSFHETNIPAAGGIFSERVFLGGSLSLSPAWYVRVGPSLNRSRLQNTPIRLERWELDAELGWKPARNFKVMFTANTFTQEPGNRLLTNFDAQQTNAVLTLHYLL